ncbi:MAG: sigma-70 family RNA polymerase sigma factor [Acidobacteriota bacterium]
MDFLSFGGDYVGKLRNGEPEVERHFAAHFGHLLEIKLRARLRARTLVEDARQETLLRVLATLRNPSKRQPENLGAFVNAVCNNVLLELFRAESRTSPMAEDAPEPMDRCPNPEMQVVTADQRRTVDRVLAEMTPRDRDLIRGVFLEEADKDEVCRLHQVDREYLRVLLHRAKARFRVAMGGSRRAAIGS